jgi:O-methyltransferase
MNHGYARLGTRNDFRWLCPEDRDQRFSANLVRYVVRHAPLSGARVLDVGCGRGGICSYLDRYHEPQLIYGIDLEPRHIRLCQRHHKSPRLKFRQGDAQNMPFSDGEFDCVVNIESSHCYANIGAFYSEVFRVLRPGGMFCYADLCASGAYDRLQKKLRAAGLCIAAADDITANVAHAMRLDRGIRTSFLSMATARNAVTLSEIYRGIRSVIPSYENGTLRYFAWTAVKPEGAMSRRPTNSLLGAKPT